jgi:hypothetical protein
MAVSKSTASKGRAVKTEYKGVLAKKLPHDPDWESLRTFSNLRSFASIQPKACPAATLGDYPPDAPRDQFALRVYPDLAARVDALYEAHKITPGDDDALLFALVTTHVPGLSVTEKHGPKTTWSQKKRAQLHVDVDEYIKSIPSVLSR